MNNFVHKFSTMIITLFLVCFVLTTPQSASAEQNPKPVKGWVSTIGSGADERGVIYFFWNRDRTSGRQIVTIYVLGTKGKKGYFIDGQWASVGNDKYKIVRSTGSWVVDLKRARSHNYKGKSAQNIRQHETQVSLRYDPEYQKLRHEIRMLPFKYSDAFAKALGQATF